jgi:hypothetical protein
MAFGMTFCKGAAHSGVIEQCRSPCTMLWILACLLIAAHIHATLAKTLSSNQVSTDSQAQGWYCRALCGAMILDRTSVTPCRFGKEDPALIVQGKAS